MDIENRIISTIEKGKNNVVKIITTKTKGLFHKKISSEICGSGFFVKKNYILTIDNIINPGNSGGPLLNTMGDIIGMNTLSIYDSNKISFALKIDFIKEIIEGKIRSNIVKSFILIYKKQIIVLTILNLITNLFILVNPLLLQYFIDTILIGNRFSSFKYLITLLIISYMVSIISLFFSNYYSEYCNVNIFKEKSYELVSIVLNSSMYLNTGDTMSRITDNLRLSISLITSVIPRIILNIFVIIIPLVIMFYINYSLTIVILLPNLLFIITSYFIGNHVEKIETALLNTNSELFSLFKEMFTSKEFIKSFGIIDLFLNKYDLKIDEYKQVLKYAKINSLNFSLESIITGIPILILILYGGYLIINKELTLGEFILFMSYIYLLFSPIAELSYNWIEYKKINPAIKRINELYELLESELGNEKLNIHTGEIIIKNLNFSYDKSKEIFNNINLIFHPGMNYIIGENGSGKSTLLKLICRV